MLQNRAMWPLPKKKYQTGRSAVCANIHFLSDPILLVFLKKETT